MNNQDPRTDTSTPRCHPARGGDQRHPPPAVSPCCDMAAVTAVPLHLSGMLLHPIAPPAVLGGWVCDPPSHRHSTSPPHPTQLLAQWGLLYPLACADGETEARGKVAFPSPACSSPSPCRAGGVRNPCDTPPRCGGGRRPRRWGSSARGRCCSSRRWARSPSGSSPRGRCGRGG